MEPGTANAMKQIRHGGESLFRRSRLSIGTRLSVCFVAIVVSMIAADVIVVWQLERMAVPTQRLSAADQASLAIVRVHLDVDVFQDRAAELARSHDAHQFANEVASLRHTFIQDVEHTEQALGESPAIEQDPTISSALETLKAALPSQLDTMLALATAGDWNALGLRLVERSQDPIRLSALLLERLNQQVLQLRAKAVENIQQARRQLFIAIPIAALLTLFAAAALGWYTTRIITVPLSELAVGAQALARGDFQHQVEVGGDDELTVLGKAFNYAARRLNELYEGLRRSEKELRQILDFTPQHVTVLRPDGSRLYLNQAGLDYYGLTLEEWRAHDARRFFHPDDVERVKSNASKFLSGSPCEIEARLRRKDGKYRWFLIRRNPLRDEQGRITHWYAAATDIEDRKQAEQRLHDENVALREEIDKASMFEEIVGISPALHAVLSRVSKVAPTDSTVLISGETGTGKELIARAVHKRSERSSRAFVSVNCAAVPRELIASELFGHEKGAFTGATQRRLGRFELAEGGTIFLDEVGELPAETQIALLRVLQEHEFERVGGTGSIRTDVRVLAATNRDLEAAIAAGTFRSDLFYRLNVFPIEVPPLRERKEDIPLLVEYFIDRCARKAGKSIRGVNKKSLELLQSYPWPGNIRELQNVIERSVVVCDTENFSVDASWLSRQPPIASEPKGQLELARKPAAKEREIIEAALRESGGRVYGPSGAASKLGIPRSTLESKIRSLKISKSRFKAMDSSKNS